ncbi:MAG: hypothetical protein ACN4GR_07000 [Arenicellales bacterium]
MTTMNYVELENWAERVMQELQDFCDEAQVADGNPYGENCLPGTRALMEEFERIKKLYPFLESYALTDEAH